MVASEACSDLSVCWDTRVNARPWKRERAGIFFGLGKESKRLTSTLGALGVVHHVPPLRGGFLVHEVKD